MTSSERIKWEAAHRGKPAGGEPEPFVAEMMPLLTRGGLVLDVAAGRGRNAIALARAGMHVVAADFSAVAMRALAQHARAEQLAIWPLLADFDRFALRDRSFDAIIDVNFLDRALFSEFARTLKPGGILLAETFLIDQAQIGHPKDPRFLLKHYELRDLMGDLDLIRYREGLVAYPDGSRAWRAGAVARRKS
ncbi:MAG TPA: class I SAM-dependent methyltransferase [Candidatus Binataceae bacterium]|nr:class I SAM-dependent methyltransferase [Candidatus Binataceae bacterium]